MDYLAICSSKQVNRQFSGSDSCGELVILLEEQIQRNQPLTGVKRLLSILSSWW